MIERVLAAARSWWRAAIDALVWSAAWPDTSREPVKRQGVPGQSRQETRLAYCPALGREVRLVRHYPAVHRKPHRHPEVVCYDFGDACTERVCPLFGLPAAVMRTRLENRRLRA